MMWRKLYTVIFMAVALMAMVACSNHKNTAKSRFWQSFSAKYNTYYNGKVAYIDGSLEKEKGNKDNFTEQLPLFPSGNKKSREIGKGKFETTVEKMEKAIKQHSIKVKPEWKKSRRKTQKDIEWLARREYNPFIWKAWLMLGMAQYQKGNFDEAAATFSYMSRLYQTQPMQYGMARAWLARCYMELDWLYDAEDVIRNMSRDSIHYLAQPAWDATYAEYYLKSGELDKAVPYLRKTIKRERRKTQKAREWFLMGQVQAALGHKQQAYKAYQRVVRQNPPYELEFNARIAQTEVMAEGNAKKMISRLKRMARSDNNKDYLDQVYYAIGNIYLMQRDTAQAIAAYEKGNEKATRNGIEKGVLLLRLGGLYWDMEKYNDAQRCYGEAIGLLDKDRPDYEELAQRSKVLDELVPYTDAVHLQDSLQELAKMPEKERLEAIDRVIEALKKKEKEEADKAREAEVEAALQKQGAVGNRNQRTPANEMQQTTNKDGSWYFYNQMTVSQGKQTFQKQWGKRENVDNWQRINRTVVASLDGLNDDLAASDGQVASDGSSGDAGSGSAPARPGLNADGTAPDSLALADLADGSSVGTEASDSLSAANAEADSLAADPHNREYYLAQIPFTEEQVQESNLIIMDGLYNSGVIFKDKLENLGLARKQLLRLTNQYPDYEQMDLAWYHLFLLYSRLGDKEKAEACLSHMQADYPESEWTILLSDPYFEENARFGEHIEDSIYGVTYDAFKADQYEVIAANSKLTEERFPLGLNRPKFIFINGLSLLNQGDAKGCVDELKKVVEKYPESEVTEMAGMIIKGVQEGRKIFGGKFDLDDIWSRRDITLAEDSTNTDTLSAERNIPFVFLLVYNPDSLRTGSQGTGPLVSTAGTAAANPEHQLLFEMARFNFTNFLVRNFDLNIEPMGGGFSRMLISGFLNFDEALQYARQLYASDELSAILRHCRSVVISETNLALMGTRYSFQDYDEFYEKTFQPLKISDEELLQIPESIDQPDLEDESSEDNGEEEGEEAPSPAKGGFDFDDDFF